MFRSRPVTCPSGSVWELNRPGPGSNGRSRAEGRADEAQGRDRARLPARACLRPEDVSINLAEVRAANGSFGTGEAQYADRV